MSNCSYGRNCEKVFHGCLRQFKSFEQDIKVSLVVGSESCTSANEEKELHTYSEVKGKHKKCIVSAFINFGKNFY